MAGRRRPRPAGPSPRASGLAGQGRRAGSAARPPHCAHTLRQPRPAIPSASRSGPGTRPAAYPAPVCPTRPARSGPSPGPRRFREFARTRERRLIAHQCTVEPAGPHRGQNQAPRRPPPHGYLNPGVPQSGCGGRSPDWVNSTALGGGCVADSGKFRAARRWLITGVRLMPPPAEQEQAARGPGATEALLGLIVLRTLAGGPYGARTAAHPHGVGPIPRRHEASALGRVTRSRWSGVSVLARDAPGGRTTPWP
ncbi:transcriptional regulator ICP4 [Streptomyces rapamycinicus NRRL 5491]|uniref:Transcriptional regulator ICP4 n=1 Tax=Streptomyces rapamycinicus (strain ATCC 29253 / DSM 41530 / NRRL 5491 / AYB-994) TaxID=1343740 RepID=A0A3L8R2D8_STRRN|nr:transcriptional regulator ICP4 [Streptomyces rapamycinicus NRRL 5491]